MPKWTKAQNDAIYADGCNILVSAAAGSGKTAVLVERVIRLITDETVDVNIDELLIVTFTNAAAAEMKSRIADSLNAALAKEPNNTNLLKQISLLPNAKICTIDSFCINLVREYFFRLNIAQDFKILEESQKAVIEQNVIDEIVEELYEQGSEEFKSLVELLSTTKSDVGLINAVKRLDDYITSQPFPFDWLNEAAELYNPEIDINDSIFRDYAVNELRNVIEYILEIIDYSISVLYPEDELFEKYSEMLESDKAEFIALYEKLDYKWDDLREALNGLSFVRTPSKRNYESDVKAIVVENRKLYNGSNSIINTDIKPFFAPSESEIKGDNEVLYPVFKQLISLVNTFHKRCFEVKRELNAYSFSDIEHFAIELLFAKAPNGEIIRSDIAQEYERNFKEILVDEYQDTNSAQDMLFEILSNGHNRFMVGDVKQSIYRFRLAMPEIFNSKKDSFTAYDKESGELNQKIILDKNFRSNREICEYTNFLFSNLMSRRIGELDYSEEEYLKYNNPELSETPSAQLNILDVPEDEEADEYEAARLADLIISKVESGELINDKEVKRPVNFGDFAVLMRSTKNRIDKYISVFSEYGIPVSASNRMNLFENNEVSILMSLLRTIDNPTLDIPLLATLMSVFYGYTADDIASARIKTRGENLFSSVAADSETFKVFLTDLDKYRGYASSMSVENLIRRILSNSSYLSVISAMGNYEQRKLNVMKLISLAKTFDSGENVGLTAFIRFIDSVIENDINLESAEVSGFDENCVKIMSVHKSKGLEFPICILAGASRKYNNDDLRSLVLLNNTYGVGLKVTNEEGLYRYNSVQYSCIKSLNTVASMSENLRVLYVAVTRAKEQFIAFASYKDAPKHINSLSKRIINSSIPSNVVKKAQSDGDLLILTALINPDGDSLRKYSTFLPSVNFKNSARLKVNIIDGRTEHKEQTAVSVPYNPELVNEIASRLEFTYGRNELSTYASKRTASSLDEVEQSYKFFASKAPSFALGGKLSGAERGTAMHAFMQYCSYEASRDDLNSEIERLVNEGFISSRQADSLNRDKLKALFNSDFSKRMFSANKLYRELKVSSFVPLSSLENTDIDEPVFVQGIADCVFEEEGELVLVDYKTDSVESEEELLKLYKNQIAFYKKAVEKTLNMPVKEAMLYSFSLEKCCIYK